MSDSEIVASIVAGEPEGLAAAYDKYAGDLYGYCQSLLREPDDAADAVQDTFVIAASRLKGLRDPERLRAWLFAVARNECLRRLASRHASSPLHDVPEPVDDSVDIGGEAERAETVALVRAAVGGLNDGERDVINQLWQGLEVSEVATVLGVSRNHAHTLFSRARDQLEASVGVLLVGRSGRRDCATLDGLLGDWDGRLTVLLRKRVGRHINGCPVCSDRRRKEFTPALLYGVSPGAVLGLAALRGGAALTAARQLAGPLSRVRGEVLRLAADPASPATAIRAAGARSTNSFGGSGFPKPVRYRHADVPLRSHLVVAGAGTVTAALVAVVALVVVPHLRPTAGSPGIRLTEHASVPSGALTTPGGPGPSPVPGAATSSGSGAAARPTGAAPATPGSPRSATRSGSTASPAATGARSTGAGLTGTVAGGPVSGAPTVSASGAPATGPAPASTPPATGASTPPATAASTPPATGTLSVSPTTVLLTPLLGGSLTLTASGGPVTWSISEPASLLGELTVSPMSGTLGAGGSVTVTITVSGLASLDTQLTVAPGDQVVTVVLGLG
jgi:RNA polymerase sigma factor (sigma-70 family)